MPEILLPGRTTEASRRIGFDCLSAVKPAIAEAFRASGHHFAVRYIKRTKGISTVTNGGSMTREEARWILEAGLALMPVQFAKKGLVPTSATGSSYGAAAAHNARLLGFTPGVTVWCDAEAFDPSTRTEDAIEHVNAWHAAVKAGGFEPGIYVGPGSKLTTEVLYKRIAFTRYWKSAARVGNVDTRGYCMQQSRSDTIHGVRVDVNVITVDAKGGQPHWCEPV